MINEDYCSYEVAKLLKEKGFDVPCLAHWFIGTDRNFSISNTPQNWNEIKTDLNWLSCPTHQMAITWLSEVYGLYIWVDYSRLDCNDKQPYLWNIVETKIDGDYWGGTYNKSPQNAIESALNYTLKNLL